MTAFPKPGPRAKHRNSLLRSRAPLRRLTWMRQRRQRKRRGPARDRDYRRLVTTLPCCAPAAPRGCSGPIDPSHTGGIAEGKGGGMKTSDYRCVPHCRKHHREYEQRRGAFSMTEEQRAFYETEAVWETKQILGYQEAA